MRSHRYLLVLMLLLAGASVQAQTVIYQEGFEGTPTVTTGGIPLWALDTTYFNTGTKSYSGHIVNAGDSSVMITNAFSTQGSQVVTLKFSHICKIEFLDAAEIYVSPNNGVTWTKLTAAHYHGSGNFNATSSDKFTSAAYPLWVPGTPGAPLNTWWMQEEFDISSIAGSSTSVKIMFMLRDLNAGTQFDNFGWMVDDIQVTIPPTQEASLEGIILPLSLPSGCGLTNETIQVRIANNGGQNISGNLTATFKREGMLAVTESVPNLIIPGDTLTYTFTNKIDLSSLVDTTYDVKAWIALLNDPDLTNDSVVENYDSKVALPDPLINDTIIPYGTSVTLTAFHNDSILWYSDPLATNMLQMGSSFTTPVLYDTAVYYVQAGFGGGGTGVMPELLYYKFDTPGPSVTNHALLPVGNNPATITGTGLTVGGMGMMGTALVGTGGTSTTHVINTGWTTNLVGSFTISFWTSNIPPSATLWYIFGDAGASTFRCFTNGVASANNWMLRGGGLPDVTIPGAATMAPNYVHFVYDATAGQMRGYLDGVLKVTVTAPTTNTVSGTGFQIGGYGSNSGLSGLMDEFRIYSHALTQAEINQSLLPVTSTCPSRVIPVVVSLSGMPHNDAGVNTITPAGIITPGTPYPIEVTVENFGLDTLKKATIQYTIDGVPQTPYVWTGNLPKYGVSAPVSIGNYTFTSGLHKIKAWTTQPNDSLDWANQNDTATSQVYSCLSGTVTLGGPGADFATFQDLYSMVSLVGLCGPTIVNVNPGTYTQQILLNNINGLSATNTLTIKSTTNNAADVIIQYAATGTADNFVLRFDAVQNITVKDITFKALGASYGRVVELLNGSSYNTLQGNRFESSVGATSSNWSAIYSAATVPCNYNLFEDNEIIGGYYGVYWYGSSSYVKKGNVFKNNKIEGYYYYGLYAYYNDSTVISGNTFTNSASSATTYPIYYYYNNGYGLIEKNRIIGTNTGTFYGIIVGYTTGVSPANVQISNNYIHQSVSTGTVYAIYLTTCGNKVNVYHNTVHVTGGSTTARCFYSTGGAGIIDVINNIFHNSGTGYAYYVGTPTMIGISNYNNFFTAGATLAYWSAARTTLAALQSASGKDANSKSVNSNFTFPMQPYLVNAVLDGAATPLAAVPDDIDGIVRSATTPDIGAVEYQLIPNDAGIAALVGPVAPCPGDTADVVVKLMNFGTSPLASCRIQWSVNGVPRDSINFIGNIPSAGSQSVVLGQQQFLAGVTYDIIAYSTFPNNVVDMNFINDTLKFYNKKAAFPAGTYTIGGTGADFPTLDTVEYILNNLGICGPVVFNINPGTYNENLVLGNIPGSSAVNTVLFKSTTGDSSSVTIQYPTGASDNYVVKLSGASYVTFRQLTFKATGTANGRVFEIGTGSAYNTIQGCRLETSITSTSSTYTGIYCAANANYHKIIGNVILGGYYGIYWYGTSSTTRGYGLTIQNNQILSAYYYGVNISYFDTLTFTGNKITSAANSSSIYGARIYYCNIIDVVANNISIAGTSTHYGMYIYYCYGVAARRNLIANNFVSLTGTGTGTWYGIYFYGNQYSDYYHNTNHIIGGSPASCYAFYQSSGSSLQIVNNIFSNTGGGYAYYVGTTAAVTTSNYNDFFTTSTTLAYWGADATSLAALQALSGKDANSKTANPIFVSNTDLHIANSILNAAGTPLVSVPLDIDGEPRHPSTPDIGADEFVMYGLIASMIDFYGQLGGCGFDSTLVTVRFVNLGADTITANSNLVLSFQVNQSPVVTQSFTDTLTSSDTAVFTFNQWAYFPLLLPKDSVYNLIAWMQLPGGNVITDTLFSTVWNGYQPPSPVVSDTTIPYATSAVLPAISTDVVTWYISPGASTPLGTGNNFTTPVLFAPKTYWVEAKGLNGVCPSPRVPLNVFISGTPPYDLGVASIFIDEGCAIHTKPVTIRVYNQGTDTLQSGAMATYQVDNLTPVTPEPVAGAIPPGGNILYTFTALPGYMPAVDTTITIKAWVTLTGDPYHPNDTLVRDSIEALYTPAAPTVTSPVTVPYGTSATLTAQSTMPLEWYASDTATVKLDTGATYITPPLFDTTTFWVQAGAAMGAPAALYTGTQSSNYAAAQTRGYHFTAPVNMVITELMVPNTVTAGTQYIQVVKFNGYPIVYPGGSTFTTLAFITNAPFGVPQQVNIPVFAGDEIGIIGACNASGTTMNNSYGQPQVASTIGGLPVVLTRLVYQSPLVSGAAASGSIGLEVSGNIARVDMTYMLGGAGCPSARSSIQVNTSPPPPIDAGISEIVNPVVNAVSNVPHEIKVRLKNYGLNTLTSATITWSLNNVLQGTYAWTGSLGLNATQVVTVDTMIFTGGTYCLDAWSSMPNGVADTVNTNDTTQGCFNACMAGTYTIGPSSTGTWDYNTFNAALNAVTSVGLCGNVIFNVQPGTYNEQLSIATITGSGPSSTVTFRSANNDSTSVILQYSATSSTDNWTIRLSGTDYFRFERMTIKANNATYGRVIEITGGADYNRFESNLLISAGASSSTTGVVYDGSTLNHYNTYLNNYMSGGYYTMYIYGSSSSSWEKGTVIQGNEIVGSYYYPMYVYYSDSVQIIGNKIHSGVAPYSYGMNVYYPNNGYRIVGNTVIVGATSSTATYGMRDYYGNYYSYNPTPSGFGLVANNIILVEGGTGANYGLYSYACNGTETYHNTISMTGGSTGSYALYQYNTTSNTLGQTYKNNIISNTGGGYTAYFSTPASVMATDYNNLYATGTNFAYWGSAVSSLSALQVLSGKELHSLNLNPPFTGVQDLHLMSTTLSGKGIQIPSVPLDIDGEVRAVQPTIGADEVMLIPKDAGISAIVTPGSTTIEGQTYPVQVVINNYGTDTIFSVPLQYTVNGGTPVPMIYSGMIPPQGIASVIMPSMVSPAGNSVICAKTLLAGDSSTFNDEYCKTFFGNPLNDGMVSRIVGLKDGCNVGLDTISIWVKNLGQNGINTPSPSTVTVHYKIKPTAPVVTETFTPVVLTNDSVLFHFTTMADFSVTTLDDTFNIVAWINLVGDNVEYNDTAKGKVVSLHLPVPPVVNNITIPYGTPVTLHAQSPDSVIWYADDTTSVKLASGAYYTTPYIYSQTTYWVEATTGVVPSSGPYVPGPNIAPLAIPSASVCNTGPCSTLNDLNLGTCGTQQMWISTSTPPTSTPHVDYLEFEWPTARFLDGMTIHHAQDNARFLTGGTMYKWDAGNWVSFYTFSNLPMQCINVVPFPRVNTTKIRITSFQMTGTGQLSNPNFREIEMHESAAEGCTSLRVPLVVSVSAPALCDVGVINIIQPSSVIGLGSQETVRVKVRNFGTAAQSNIPVSFKVDNMPVVTETLTGPLSPNDSVDYIFTAKADLSVSGNTYQLKAWTGLACDNTHQNDTLWKSVTNLLPTYCTSSATSAANEELTNITLGTLNHTTVAAGAMYTNLTALVLAPMLSPGVVYPMSVTSSFAPSATTQQSCWVKVWIDLNRDGVFDPTGEMMLSSATTSSNIVTANVTIPFTATIGNTVMRIVLNQTTAEASVQPCGTYTYGETEDYMVTISPQSACDAGVVAILEPASLVQSGVPQNVYIKFMNFGSSPIAAGTLSIAYKVNGGTPVVVAYPGSLAPAAVDSVMMTQVAFPIGNNTLCAYTILACDTMVFNNELCKGVYGEYYTTLPYFDDFETGNLWYKPTASVNWQYGTPSASIIQSAYSGNKAWVTNLTGDYTNNSDEYIYTPVFDFGGLGVTDTITLSFYHFLAFAASDYGQVQYNLNGGSGWANLGFVGDLSAINWYNTQVGGVHYFSQTNSGWMYSAYKLSPSTFNGMDTVQFRFRLYSNTSGTSNGWAIDNFKLSLPQMPNDVGITSIDYPINDTAMGSSVNASVTITNFGSNIQTMIPVLLKLNGTTITTETWTGTLPSLGTATYTFVLPFVVPSTSYQLCAETQLTGDAFPVNDSRCAGYQPLPAYHDVGVSTIIDPLPDSIGQICFYHSQAQPWYMFDVVVRLANYGQNAQTSIPVKYTFSTGGTQYSDVWTGNLAPGNTVDFTLNNQFLPALGAQQLCAETNLIGDPITTNNKACQSYTGVACIGIDDPGTDGFVLEQNIPNPANGKTLIGYTVPQGGEVVFGLVSPLGQVLQHQSTTVPPGKHQVEIDVTQLAQGVYYYFVEFNGQRITKKMVIRN